MSRMLCLALVAMILGAPGCRVARSLSEPAAVDPPRPVDLDAPAGDEGAAQASSAAADQLVAEAREALQGGQVDAAQGQLERALSLKPDHGEACYWLAEVWRQRGERDQAFTYHDLAWRYLAGEPDWAEPLKAQARALERLPQ